MAATEYPRAVAWVRILVVVDFKGDNGWKRVTTQWDVGIPVSWLHGGRFAWFALPKETITAHIVPFPGP